MKGATWPGAWLVVVVLFFWSTLEAEAEASGGPVAGCQAKPKRKKPTKSKPPEAPPPSTVPSPTPAEETPSAPAALDAPPAASPQPSQSGAEAAPSAGAEAKTAPSPKTASDPDALKDDTLEEEVLDFESEERRSDAESQKVVAGAQGGGAAQGGGELGIKLFVDLLVDYTVGEKSFEFRPNHTYVFVQVSVYDDVQFIIHVSDDPIFYELSWNATPRLTLSAGKLLVPFGINDFHHIIGGRVDELSHFLPETWGDFGLSLSHVLIDSEDVSLEYTLYAVNGFSGTEEPNIASGSLSDNNLMKGLGTRVRLSLFGKAIVSASTYYDRWDVENRYQTFFYALGLEIPPGIVDAPVLDHLRFRGEWARGEVELPERNYQTGIIGDYAFARSGFFGELQYDLLRWLALRLRVGRINPNNTVTDTGDVEVYEPAILLGLGTKVWFTIAYQALSKPGFDLSARLPADRIYGKFFLMY